MIKLTVMRKLEYWLGVPICLLLTGDYFFKKKLGFNQLRSLKKPGKILFIEFSEMGSTILAYDAIKKSQKIFPKAKFYFLIFDIGQESVKMLDLIPSRNILTIRTKNLFLFFLDSISIIWFLKKNHIDTIIDLELFTRFSAIVSYLSGAKYRIGFERFSAEGLYRGNLLTHKVIYNPYCHISQNFLNLVLSLLEIAGKEPLLKKKLSANLKGKKIVSNSVGKNKIMAKLRLLNRHFSQAKKLIILDPNYSEFIPVRSWPIENYIKLAKKILQIPNTFIIISGMGDGKSKKLTEQLKAVLPDSRCLDLSGKTTLSELVDLYNICDILVTHDSGPAHFAAMSPIRSFVLFGPETPHLYGPLNNKCKILYANFACSPCVSAFNQRHTACTDNKCLKVIKPDYVFNLIKKYLS